MIPEGWTEGKVSDHVVGLESGVSVNGAGRPRHDSEFAVLKVSAVSYGVFDAQACKVIDGPELARARTNPKAGQVIISRSNTEDLVGASAYVDSDYPHLFLPDKLWQTVPRDGANMKWLSYVLASPRNRYKLSLLATGTSGSMKNITMDELLSLKVLSPPEGEQLRIAEILSAWDQAIETTEKLIENSKAQKKALMQQLLTGKKRLPGFSNEWSETVLKNIAAVFVSPVNKKSVVGEPAVRLCNYTDVYYNSHITNSLDFMTATASNSQVERFTLMKNDLVITKDSETPGDIAVPALVTEELDGVVCGYHLAIIRPDVKVVDGAFLNHLFSQPKVRHYFSTRANGATRFGLTIDGIKEASFMLPGIEEQQKIADVLDTCDQELRCLRIILQQLTMEKRALMQQLLTGKRRVKVAA